MYKIRAQIYQIVSEIIRMYIDFMDNNEMIYIKNHIYDNIKTSISQLQVMQV